MPCGVCWQSPLAGSVASRSEINVVSVHPTSLYWPQRRGAPEGSPLHRHVWERVWVSRTWGRLFPGGALFVSNKQTGRCTRPGSCEGATALCGETLDSLRSGGDRDSAVRAPSRWLALAPQGKPLRVEAGSGGP